MARNVRTPDGVLIAVADDWTVPLGADDFPQAGWVEVDPTAPAPVDTPAPDVPADVPAEPVDEQAEATQVPAHAGDEPQE